MIILPGATRASAALVSCAGTNARLGRFLLAVCLGYLAKGSDKVANILPSGLRRNRWF
jgi:hypothetical protein